MVEGGGKCGWRQSAGFDQEARLLLRVLFSTNMRQRRSFFPKRMTGETEDDHERIKETNSVRAPTRKLEAQVGCACHQPYC